MLFLEKEEWRTRAVCNSPEFSYNDFFEGFERKTKVAKAQFLAITCDICPVIKDCYEYAQRVRPIAGLHGGKYWRAKGPKPPLRINYSDQFRESELFSDKAVSSKQ